MTTFAAALRRDEPVFWRVDRRSYASGWDSGEGAFRVGGRWNSKGVRCVYCALEPSTAVLEVAVHMGFAALRASPYVLTKASLEDVASLHIVEPSDIPRADWLTPRATTGEQQRFGDALLAAHRFVAIRSTVMPHSWNLIFSPSVASGLYAVESQEALTLDPRLAPR